jgi:hypothetical protein
MNGTLIILKRIPKKKFITALLIVGSLAAFATLGDGSSKKTTYSKNLLSYKPTYNYKHFTLKSGYNYRGSNIFSYKFYQKNYITFNKVITFQKGNTTYILPLKRKVLLDKIKFTSATPRY